MQFEQPGLFILLQTPLTLKLAIVNGKREIANETSIFCTVNA